MTETATVAPATDSSEPAEITEPGVYPGLPEDVYHRHSALSSSGARKLLAPSCPALFKYDRDHGQKPKREFDLGRAAHRVALGAGAEIHVIEWDSYRTNAAKDEREEARANGLTPLLAHEHAQVLAMAAALTAHPFAGKLFNADRGQPEQSLFWHDPRTGIFCRARLDWYPVRGGRRLIVPDYKSAASAEPSSFARSFHSFGYFLQAWWYLAGVKALGLSGDAEPAFVFVVQEKTAPYLVTVFEPDADALRAGRSQMREALDVYAECQRTGEWPPYSTGIELVSLPAWAARQYEESPL